MPGVLNVEDAHIVGCRDNGPVVRIGHEFDREDIAAMARYDGRGQAELRGRRLGVVRVDVDAVVVGAGCE